MTVTEERIESGERAFGDLTRRVIHGEEQLTEIKSQLEKLNESIKQLNRTIADMGKPHYQTWAAVGGLVCTVTAGVWWLAVTPIDTRVKSLEAANASYVLKEMYADKLSQIDKEFIRLENDIRARASKDDLNRLIIEIDQRLPKSRGK